MKKTVDVKKPKAEVRIGFESMECYHSENQLGAYRMWFKGNVVVFNVVERKQHEMQDISGSLLTLIRASNRAAIYYQAFERPDGVCFFLGESNLQIVDESQRNLEAIRANRFN